MVQPGTMLLWPPPALLPERKHGFAIPRHRGIPGGKLQRLINHAQSEHLLVKALRNVEIGNGDTNVSECDSAGVGIYHDVRSTHPEIWRCHRSLASFIPRLFSFESK